ncbi:MAG: YraN family protein, partial [Synergistaceae bacterium]|nr:YraN family protein [Synergistaceae bacterium]
MSLERALDRSIQERNKIPIQKSSGKGRTDPSKKLPLHLQTGKYGEEKAAEYLTQIGYRIIAKNVSCRHGEIDIIANDGDEIVFVEVRTRSFGWVMPPEFTVGPEKIKKLKRAARIWTES